LVRGKVKRRVVIGGGEGKDELFNNVHEIISNAEYGVSNGNNSKKKEKLIPI